jgi:cystathionine beta-lyase/cystathionine gamma-synthase
MARQIKRIETKLIHAGEPNPKIGGAISLPIFQSSTFESVEGTDYHSQRYIRLNNTPNHIALHEKLAALENAEAALVAGSGMAAISSALMTVLSAGDHLLAQGCLYGGSNDLLTREFPSMGISYDFIDGDRPEQWKSKLRPNTKAIYVETMSNPLLEVPDLRAVAEFAREHQIVSMIDNTFASPINFRPAELGFDLSLHSGTKYLNGHSDIVAGAVIGKADLVRRVNLKLNHLGGTLDPHACFLLHRGMKTLAVRVRYQNESTLKIARYLENHPAVAHVNYPGLESHRQHRRASEMFEGFGGVLSFELKGAVNAAEHFISRVKLPFNAPSLGGVESLVTRPSRTSHSGMPAEERARAGISDGLIRLSVGLEATDDLLEDFAQALES